MRKRMFFGSLIGLIAGIIIGMFAPTIFSYESYGGTLILSMVILTIAGIIVGYFLEKIE